MENTIDLQNKTNALPGTIEYYWFENKNAGITQTLFHRIYIPLEPFDSGLSYVEQPEKTKIVFDWYKLNLQDPNNLDGLNLNHNNYSDAEASVYIGSAHNWCNIIELKLQKLPGGEYSVHGELEIDFDSEGVGRNDRFNFDTKLMLNIQ